MRLEPQLGWLLWYELWDQYLTWHQDRDQIKRRLWLSLKDQLGGQFRNQLCSFAERQSPIANSDHRAMVYTPGTIR